MQPVNINLIDNPFMEHIAVWQAKNGGQPSAPKYAALKVLEEVLELCYISGAVLAETEAVFLGETQKALERGEAAGNFLPDLAETELGDSLVCLYVYALHNNMHMDTAISDTLDRIDKREWKPDIFGILRRPRPPEVEQPA